MENLSFLEYPGASNLPEIIDWSEVLRFANKKSMILNIFGKSFISRIPGNLNYPRKPGIRTNLGNFGFYRNSYPKKHSPPKKLISEELFTEKFKFLGVEFRGEKFRFSKGSAYGNFRKYLICQYFRDLLRRNQGFREYLDNPSFLEHQGAGNLAEIIDFENIWKLLHFRDAR